MSCDRSHCARLLCSLKAVFRAGPCCTRVAWSCCHYMTPIENTREFLQQARHESGPNWGPTVFDIVFCFQYGGGGRTRTYEGVSQRIYSPPPLPLGTLPHRGG